MKPIVTLVFAAVACAPVATQDQVLVGTSANGKVRAYLSGESGLVVEGWGAAKNGVLTIGHGSEPRFDATGDLYFRRVTDDGRQVTGDSTWIVARTGTTPRRLAPGAAVPAYRLPMPPPGLAAIKVCVDAGHGGTDPGATGNGLKEKDINLDVTLRLKALLVLDTLDTRGGGEWNVLMTRPTNTFVSLSQRTNMANAFGAKTFVSVHMNAFSSSSANGSETYCYTGQESKAGGAYRNRLHLELRSAWGLTNRGTKSAGFYVLRYTSMPAALVEGGFITNAGDAKKMADASARQRLALGLLWATQEQHGITRYTPSKSGGNGTLRGIVYDASKGTSTPIPGATVSLASGDFITSSATSAGFQFSLAPGRYRYAATAPGFDPVSGSKTITASTTTWGSLGLRPASVPALTGPARPIGGFPANMYLQGDANSPVLLLIGGRPGIPLFTFGSFGKVWPDLASTLVFSMGTMPTAGTKKMTFQTPAQKGLRAHLQCLVRFKGQYRASNGAAIELQ